jgi:hypothetical protein
MMMGSLVKRILLIMEGQREGVKKIGPALTKV